jgi:hypothetical protein
VWVGKRRWGGGWDSKVDVKNTEKKMKMKMEIIWDEMNR